MLSHFSTTRNVSGPHLVWKASAFSRVDGGAVLDAARLLVDVRHVAAEVLQDLGALAGLGGDDGDDVDHVLSRMMSSGARPSSQKTIAFCSKSWPSASAFAR